MLSEIIKNLKNLNYKNYVDNFFKNELSFRDVKISKQKWESINKENSVPIGADINDLVRLHYLVSYLKSRVILEFGVGKSTIVFADALSKNKEKYEEYVKEHLRVSEPFVLYSVDNSEYWLNETKSKLPNYGISKLWFSECCTDVFNGKICTYYENMPNIRPDFIYLDGPSQFGVKGNVRGISTDNPDRMPMSADLLAMEYFLEPGTFIVVDGRTANARFLKNNFQRTWEYEYLVEFDQHFFYLDEDPLGIWNEATLNFVNLKY
jgi:hypothetical protein